MLDSSSCMLVRREVTQPWRAVDALESIVARLLFGWIDTRLSIAFGAFKSLINSVNIRSCPAALRLIPSPTTYRQEPEAAICKPAMGTTSEGPPDYRPIPSHLNPVHQHHHITSQCLSSARSSPSKLVSSWERPCERRKEEEPRMQSEGQRTCSKKRPSADECSQLQSSPCGRSTPPVRYPRIRPLDLNEKRERAQDILWRKGS
jgi:hypothetical protein